MNRPFNRGTQIASSLQYSGKWQLPVQMKHAKLNAFGFAALRLTESLFMEFLAEIERKGEGGQKVVIPLSCLIITAMNKKHSAWG